MKATAVLLNWKRPENLKKLIKIIRSQTIETEILLWNNNPKDQTNYEVDLQINSNTNLRCWSRWSIATFGKGDYLFVIDDDIMFNSNNVVKECVTFHQQQKKKDLILGYTGVVLNDELDYRRSKHILTPDKRRSHNVDIVKGRFMFMHKEFLNNINIPPYRLYRGDDIYVSSFSKNKIIPSFLYKKLVDLEGWNGETSLFKDPNHKKYRMMVTKYCFSSPRGMIPKTNEDGSLVEDVFDGA